MNFEVVEFRTAPLRIALVYDKENGIVDIATVDNDGDVVDYLVGIDDKGVILYPFPDSLVDFIETKDNYLKVRKV